MSSVPGDILTHLENIHKYFVWNGKRPKIKHSTLLNDYSNGGLKYRHSLKNKSITIVVVETFI